MDTYLPQAQAHESLLSAAADFPEGSVMRTAQVGDRVQVRWTKLFQDGSLVSSRGHAPTELTIGLAHPRLPGLGLALVGVAIHGLM